MKELENVAVCLLSEKLIVKAAEFSPQLVEKVIEKVEMLGFEVKST